MNFKGLVEIKSYFNGFWGILRDFRKNLSDLGWFLGFKKYYIIFILHSYVQILDFFLRSHIFQNSLKWFLIIQFLVIEPQLNIWLCLCGVCVPWMDAMLQSVKKKRQLYSHNQYVNYMYTHSHGHNIDMNKTRILAWAPAPALHEHTKFLSQVFWIGF